MPVPKRKRSKSRRDKRFANKGLKVKTFAECKNCQAPVPCHQVCNACGFYKGQKVLTTKIDRSIKRGKERQEKMAKQKGRTEPIEAQPEEVKDKA